VQNDTGGASVTVTVEDLENRRTEAFLAEFQALRSDLVKIQHRLQSEEHLRLMIEAKYQAVVGDVLPMLLDRAASKHEFNIGRLAAPIIVEVTAMHKEGDTYNISDKPERSHRSAEARGGVGAPAERHER
jgi:hypothetical protein